MAHIATRKQLARNLTSGWVLLVAEVAVAFILTPFIIAKLGAAAYGVWALMISVIGYMGLIDIGIRGSVGRYVNHYMALNDSRALDEVVGTASVVLTGLSVVALAGAFVIATYFQQLFPKTPPALLQDIQFALPLLAVGLWLSFISSILGNLLAAREAMYLTNQFALLTLALRTVAIVWALQAGHGIPALVLVTVATSALGVAIAWWAVRRVFAAQVPRLVRFSSSRLVEMWRFGVASFTARTAATLANDSAPIIGMWTLGPEAVAVYSVAMTLTQYARRLIDQAGSVIFPSVMKAGAIKDFDGLRALYLRYMNLSFAIGSLVFIGAMVFSHSFLGLWVGPDYQAGAAVVGILAFGYLMQGVASTAPLMLASLDRVNLTMQISLVEALACVVLMAVLPYVFGMGLAGMALGATLPRLVSNCLVYPRLAVQLLGPASKGPMLQHLRSNLLLCAGVAVVFVGVYWVIPGRTWHTLVAAVVLVTVLHLLAMGSRYESIGAVARVRGVVRGWAHRLRGGSA
jgi:O-antigen/teichoic acid export membrane protein